MGDEKLSKAIDDLVNAIRADEAHLNCISRKDVEELIEKKQRTVVVTISEQIEVPGVVSALECEEVELKVVMLEDLKKLLEVKSE